MTDDDFNRKRRNGLIILIINEFLAVFCLFFFKIKFNWLFYTSLIYFIVSTLLLFNRLLKKKPKVKEDNSNYIYGKKLGDKMFKVPQKFILEAMLMSLSFIIIADIVSFLYAIFFTNISTVYKIVAGVSGFFGAIFMLMILITTFQQYKQLNEAQDFVNQMTLQNAKNEIMQDVFKEELKGGEIQKWLKK